jgi:hypothetical protein
MTFERRETLDPDPDPDDELEDEEEEEEEESDRDPRIRGVGADPTPAVSMPAAAQASRSQRQRSSGSSHKGKEVRKRGRVPGDATRPTQADLLWLDILERKEIVSQGIQAEHFAIKVFRLDGGQEIYLTSIDGMRCAGDGSDGSAGETLLRILTDEIHWHSSKGLSATYLLQFSFKRGGTIYDRGKIRLPSTQEIGQMRAAEAGLGRPQQQQQHYQQSPPQYGPGMGNGYPPPFGPQGYAPQGFGAPPGYPPYPPYPPYGYPPPAIPTPSTGDEVADLREQVRSLSEMMRDMWRFGPQGYGGQPGYPGMGPQGFGQPMQPQAPQQLPLSVLGQLREHLAPFGLTIAAQQQPQAGMVPASSGFHQGLGQLKELAHGVVALKEVADALNGVFNSNAQQMVEEEPKPEPDFEMVEVPGSKWPNGDPVRYARDDKGINWFGTAMGNSFAMEKFGSTVAGIGRKIVSQINKEQGIAGLPDDGEEEEEEEEQRQQQHQQQRAVVTPPPANPPPPRMNGARSAPPDDGFSL